MPSSISKHRKAAFKRQNGRCYYCELPMWLNKPTELAVKYRISAGEASRLRCTAEHLLARQDGGVNSGANIVAACIHCNKTRHLISSPPDPTKYREYVLRRLRAGKWHTKNVHHLLTSSP